TFLIGIVAWYVDRLLQDSGGTRGGGLSVFWNLLLMAIVARTAYALERSGGRTSVEPGLICILLICVAIGVLDNAKTRVMLPLVTYFATTFFYGGHITKRQISVALLAGAALVFLVSPMIHTYRALGIQDKPWSDKLTLLQHGVRD